MIRNGVGENWRIVGLYGFVALVLYKWTSHEKSTFLMVTLTKHHSKNTQHRVTIWTKFMNVMCSSTIHSPWLISSEPSCPTEGMKKQCCLLSVTGRLH